ncbi:transcriptional regulator [Clostridium tyrobutyricum]|uniref:Uncharacterized protein n=1 Tax=Clostridium tyrobutyricum DIVETGP TaxID=1408889 RepID=W6NKX0_CLOTY|nr:hypothetical protein [Clostridium tyrobutyricum]AND85594.1 hypothetical protein CTK_C23460 [Clostridium tyrobutyricum]ANP70120.1 hypothetical protein BA182_10635 [Clostridium tyrobutyricum]MBV4433731.1 transcriptional regulator [Clostridium tyrobutyricum]QNB65519.1 transcriptional regulator [Clostridium tyrobutyricum]CDL92497.1 FIG00521441: hypothetical protein [Clostridium tyrobutyricum DIVETGP]
MSGNRSFKEYVAERFYNEMFATVQSYTGDNYDDLDLRLYRIRNIGGIELSDIEIKYVSVNDLPDMKIEFDVAVEAEFEVRESDYHYDESENCRQWFMVECSGDLDCNLDDLAISSITEYTSKNKQPKPMSDSLVPIIHKEQLESVATDFLRRHYPEALKTPIAVEPQVLAEKMGLVVEMREITKDFSVFGQIYFHDCDAEFYDKNSDEMVQTHVDARTIFVDPKAYFLRNLGSVNNTIVHECVHWDKHRKAFELERLYNSSASKIKCQVVGGIKDNIRDAADWMEWQANALAPRIQMPLIMFKTKAFEFIKQFRTELGTSKLIDVMEPVIDALAAFFCVSRLAAKIRMIDAGYEEAIGTFTYIDGHYVKPHRFKKGTLQRNQTFSIGVIDAAIESIINPQLRDIGVKGIYQYVDSHFVLNHPKYLTQDENGFAVLTNYALNHMDECCLVFVLSVKAGCREKYNSECFLNRDESSAIDFEIKYCNGYENSTKEKQNKYLEELMAENAKMYDLLSNNYLDCLDKLRKWRKITFVKLNKKVLMDERQLRRIFKGESKGSLNALLSICLAMHLPPEISFHIIEKSPFTLSMGDENHRWYRFVLIYYYGKSMDEIRCFLAEHNVEPL